MVQIRLEQDILGLIRHLRGASDAVKERVLRRAIGAVGTKAFNMTKKSVAKEMGTTVRTIAGKGKHARLILVKPRRFGGMTDWTTSIIGTGKPLPLASFKGGRQRKGGVSIAAWGKRKIYPHSFYATMPTGHRGVFVRKSGATTQNVGGSDSQGRPRRSALPIKELFGPSVPRTLAMPVFASAVQKIVKAEMPRQINRALQFELSKLASR